MDIELSVQARSLFNLIDRNGDGKVTKAEFVDGMVGAPHVDMNSVEAGRLFDNLDKCKSGFVELTNFEEAVFQLKWLQSLVKIFSVCQDYEFTVRPDYDYSKTTNDNYKESNPVYVGVHADIRATRDYSWHTNYTVERQAWQDIAVRCCLGKTEPQARPWLVYTCGPMGAGKGHVFSWLSSQGLFPLEFVVHIDPDFFKRIMPEWKKYAQLNTEYAGTACHQESGYIQEIATEVAMRDRQNLWVDGSMSDGPWFSKIFDDIRSRFPHYRIAIFHISATEQTIRSRIEKRCLETGRSVPENQIQRSLLNPENTIQMLAHKTDLIVRIWNENSIILKSVEDHSGNWFRGLDRHFGCLAKQNPDFPFSLSPIYYEITSLVNVPFISVTNSLTPSSSRVVMDSIYSNSSFQGYMAIKDSSASEWKICWLALSNQHLICCRDHQSCDGQECNANSILWNYSVNSNWKVYDNRLNNNHLHATTKKRKHGNSLRESISKDNIDDGCVDTSIDDESEANTSDKCDDNDDKANYCSDFCVSFPDDQGDLFFIDICFQHYDVSCMPYNRRWIEILSHSVVHGKSSLLDLESERDNCLREWTISIDAVKHSPNIRKFLSITPEFHIKSTSICKLEGDKALVNVPVNTSHFRWFFPSRGEYILCVLSLLSHSNIFLNLNLFVISTKNSELQQFNFAEDGIDLNDPDVSLLLNGGFAYYNISGMVLGCMAMSKSHTQHFVSFTEPEHLDQTDALMLHSRKRWISTTIQKFRVAKAKYFTFIHPNERLVTRKFPSQGCFAYLFREPDEPSSELDRFFPIAVVDNY